MSLSTDDIKKLIPTWFSNCKSNLAEFYCYDDEEEDEPEHAEYFNAKEGATKEDVLELMSECFANPKNWKRASKSKLEQNASQFFIENRFVKDFIQSSDQNLIDSLKDKYSKCWNRQFHPSNELFADNFRLNVISDPEDTKIVGWVVMSD